MNNPKFYDLSTTTYHLFMVQLYVFFSLFFPQKTSQDRGHWRENQQMIHSIQLLVFVIALLDSY